MSSKNPRFSLNGNGHRPEQPSADQRKQQVVEALDSRFKQINKLWEAAEADLKQIPVPFDVKLCYKVVDADSFRPGEFQIHSYLGFVRSKGGWRICIGGAHDAFPYDDYGWKPITECGVDLRLEAVPYITKLRDLVLKAAEECVPKLDKAIADLRSTLQSW